jgi:hypothetical protein
VHIGVEKKARNGRFGGEGTGMWNKIKSTALNLVPSTALGKRHFKSKFLEALKKVGEVYPEAQKLRAEQDVLVYVPGYPDVAPITPR